MSLMSTDPSKRIFVFSNTFSHQSGNYLEQFYYLIDSVEYGDFKSPVKVDIKKILFIESYLNGEFQLFSEISLFPDIPPQILKAVKEWEETKKHNRY